MGAREKYSASPSKLRTTLVMLGSITSFAFRWGRKEWRSYGVVLDHLRHHGVDHAGIEQRLVALNVDVNIRRALHRDFGHAVGAAAMIRAGEHGFPAESLDGALDARVVGGDHDGGEQTGDADAFDDVLDHGPAGNHGQGLSRKARGSVARGDDSQDAWGRGVRHRASAGRAERILARLGSAADTRWTASSI